MFTAKERIERDGFLVAYEGETMTDSEAARRGLIDGCEDDSADVFHVGTPAAEDDQTAVVEPPIDEATDNAADDDAADNGNEVKPTRAELREECEKRGIKAPKNATVAQLEALLGD